jgi:hypothetical protein
MALRMDDGGDELYGQSAFELRRNRRGSASGCGFVAVISSPPNISPDMVKQSPAYGSAICKKIEIGATFTSK